ncbi:MAG: hypothetical protein IT373_13065 [Polyangiaceae bacterium]|nr:hypothetical protein [Polyangiaceae bacterium]
MSCEPRSQGRLRLLALAGATLGLGATGCTIDTFLPIDVLAPAGVIAGSVTYAGPPPCTQGGRIVGLAALLAFDERLLPPPEGLGTSAAGLAVVSPEILFQGIFGALPMAPDGSLVCPPAGTPPVTVTAPFEIAPLGAGTYQVRGFYDYDGDFDAGFSLFNLPTAGDVGGGAIDNTAEVLLGAGPKYRSIGLGDVVVVPNTPESCDEATGVGCCDAATGKGCPRVIPDTGAAVEGVAVTLGLQLPLERPVFHYAAVLDQAFGNTDPTKIEVPSDYQLNVFALDLASVQATENSFVRLRLAAGVPTEEQDLAAASPFFFPDTPLHLSRADTNFDGIRDGEDHIPETELVPALAPQGIFSKLADGGTGYSPQDGPSIILQGVTLYQPVANVPALLQTLGTAPDLSLSVPDVLVALRPAVLCLDVSHPEKGGTLLNTHPTDKATPPHTLVPDEAALEATLSKQFGRIIKIKYGCLPQGKYALNLIYDTGQVWSVPNEAGVCMPAEPAVGDTVCGTRPRLASQATVVEIVEPTDPTYCVEHPTPPECVK